MRNISSAKKHFEKVIALLEIYFLRQFYHAVLTIFNIFYHAKFWSFLIIRPWYFHISFFYNFANVMCFVNMCIFERIRYFNDKRKNADFANACSLWQLQIKYYIVLIWLFFHRSHKTFVENANQILLLSSRLCTCIMSENAFQTNFQKI